VSASDIIEGSSSGYSYAKFTGLNMMDGKYTVSVTGINEVKMYSQKRSSSFDLVTVPPSLTGKYWRLLLKFSIEEIFQNWCITGMRWTDINRLLSFQFCSISFCFLSL
jgi:hypothetical protein